MGVMLSLPVWLASNLYPIWMSYRLLEGYRVLSLRSARGAQFAENSEELREAKDNMIKFWVMHATLRILGSVVSRGTFASKSPFACRSALTTDDGHTSGRCCLAVSVA